MFTIIVIKKVDMRALKKIIIYFLIYLASLIVLMIVGAQLRKITGIDFPGWIISIYAGVPLLALTLAAIIVLFKGTSFIVRQYYLFCVTMFFKKSHPDINFSKFTTSDLNNILIINSKTWMRQKYDIPRLSKKELSSLSAQATKENLINAGKAAWWLTKTSAKVSMKTLEVATDAMNKINSSSQSINTSTSTPSKSTQNFQPSSSKSNNSDTRSQSSESPKADWYGKAYAMQGAVVTKSDGSSMAYYKKCETCGHVDTTSHHQTSAPLKGQRFETSFRCQKCGKDQKLQIGAG
jgi:hypothetical protein